MKRVYRCLVLGVCLIAAVAAATWPLVRDLEDLTVGNVFADDASFALWHPWNVLRQLGRGDDPFFAPDLYWPQGLDTTLYVWNLLVPVLRAPVYLLTHPIRAYPLSDLLFGVLNGIGGYVLGRVVGGRRSAGLAAALFVATSAYTWAEFNGGRGEQGLIVFVLLSIAGLIAMLRGGGRGVAVGTGAAFAAAASCYWMYGYFLVLVAAVVVTGALLRRRVDRPVAGRLLLAGIAAVLLTLPSLLPVLLRIGAADSVYRQAVGPESGFTPRVEGLSLASLAWPFSPYDPASTHPRTTFGVRLLVVVGLAVPAIRRRSGWLPYLGLGALLLALGPVLTTASDEPLVVGGRQLAMPFALVAKLPGMERLWWAVRWMALALVATAGVLAACVAALPGARSRACLVAAVAALGILECHAVNSSARGRNDGEAPYALPAMMEVLGREPGEHPLVQMPLHGTGYPAWHPYHRQPVAGGIGDGNPLLMPPWFARQLGENPTMGALSHISRGREPRVTPADPEGDLCGLGFHYLIYWTADPASHRTLPALQALMGRLPDHSEPRLLAWRLSPCAEEAPLPTGDSPSRRAR